MEMEESQINETIRQNTEFLTTERGIPSPVPTQKVKAVKRDVIAFAKQGTIRQELKEKNLLLIRAIETKDVKLVEEVIHKVKADHPDGDCSRIINYKQGKLEITAITLAAYHNVLDIVQLLLAHGGQAKIKDRIGRTALHYAANNGSCEMVALLVANGAEVNAKIHITTWIHKEPGDVGDIAPMPSLWGRTPLHCATAGLHYDCVETLLDHGASVQCVDEAGLPPLLTLAELPDSVAFVSNYEKIMALLIQRKCDLNVAHPVTGRTVMFQAIELGSLASVKMLLAHGVNVFHTDANHSNILHAAARSTKPEMLIEIVKACHSMVNAKNKDGETPLHYAAYAGSRVALKILLEEGGDLSQVNSVGLTVTDVIFSFLPRPSSFITETLDSKFKPNQYSINEKLFNVTLDFRVLAPEQSDHQMSVILALMNSITFAQKSKIMLHPLVEAFVRLKWDRLRYFFFLLVLLHFSYVLSLSICISCLVLDDHRTAGWANPVLVSTALLILVNLGLQSSLSPRRFYRNYEFWLTVLMVMMSLSISMWYVLNGSDHGAHTQQPEDNTTTPHDRGNAAHRSPTNKEYLPEWVRHVASYDILLAWTQLMFLIGKYPFSGHFTLMFYTVFRNVLKLLLFYVCLVIGFSLSFCIQFKDQQFDNPWLAFVRTTVMVMGEYDFNGLFKEEKELGGRFGGLETPFLFITSRVIFLFFVLIGSIVLMNLMTGLAVNDIQSLQTEGNLRHMMKQVEFLSHVENILSSGLACLPKKILDCHRNIHTQFTINPSAENRICETRYKTSSKMPFRLVETIVLLSVKNQKAKFKKQSEVILLKDGITVGSTDSLDKQLLVDTMCEMKTELRILSQRINAMAHSDDEQDSRSTKYLSTASNSSFRSFKFLRRSQKNRIA